MPKEIIGFGERPHSKQDAEEAARQRIGFLETEIEERTQKTPTTFEVGGFGRELRPHKEIKESEDPVNAFLEAQEIKPALRERIKALKESLDEREIGMYKMLTEQLKKGIDGTKEDNTSVHEQREKVREWSIGINFFMDDMSKLADAFRWRIFTTVISFSNQKGEQQEKMITALEENLTEELTTIEQIAVRWVAEHIWGRSMEVAAA